jgi:hypothetical protein
MLMFLASDQDEAWEEEPDDDRQACHTAIITALTVVLLGLWLLSSMLGQGTGRPAPPALPHWAQQGESHGR